MTRGARGVMSVRVAAVLFGGRSLEHDVSIVSGLQILHALDPESCTPMPVYIDQQLRWWTGDPLWHSDSFKRGGPDRSRLTEVQLAPGFGTSTLLPVRTAGTVASPPIPVDVFLPILHGTYGEDGAIQGLLEVSGCAYVGCGVTASALGMNKRLTKIMAQQAQVPVVPWIACERAVLERGHAWMDDVAAQVDRSFGWPVIVKPCNLGSSAGVSTATTRDELAAGILKVFEYDVEALVEPFIKNRLELNVAVAGLDQPVPSVTEMPATSTTTILSFSEKYKRQGGKSVGTSQGMAGALRVLDPQDLPEEMRRRAQGYAVTVFQGLGCEGISRIDFLIDADSGELFFNEINTLPGSLAFYLWSA
ncbi:MAG: D-alanine--D-alanine ligase family protein, partial [Vicinamibacterales bacterium]